MLKLFSAIISALTMACLIGAVCLGGMFVYSLVIDAALWVQIVVGAFFALIALIYWIEGAEEDEDNA
ncbi:hypothetical protein EV294_112101 [Paenibacillus sp. BK033]|uniref:hypothetical protein n=1 Tax=Paenibacillus sp. BK033 TaxID=2512133 RepID=UPI001051CFAB|nr:hypothetical protein [Paenibacillus sp. BK033]TCM89636.1 hypothetical protein EV294_112101 [Paenibacillus sp. BK033]